MKRDYKIPFLNIGTGQKHILKEIKFCTFPDNVECLSNVKVECCFFFQEHIGKLPNKFPDLRDGKIYLQRLI